MRLNYSSRFWLFAPLALLAAVALVVMAQWWNLAGALDKKLDALNGHEAAPGITVSFATKAISGFPFKINIVFTGFAVAGQGAHGPLRWTSEKFALHRLTYGRAQDIYEAAGNQVLSWSDGGGSHSLKFLPGALHASAITDAKGLLRFDLDMIEAGGSDGRGRRFTAAHVQWHMRRDPAGDALDVMVKGEGIKSEGAIASLFGDQIKTLELYATLTHGKVFAPLLAGKANWSERAAAWRAAGGETKITSVNVQSAGVTLQAKDFADSDNDLRDLLEPFY